MKRIMHSRAQQPDGLREHDAAHRLVERELFVAALLLDVLQVLALAHVLQAACFALAALLHCPPLPEQGREETAQKI